MRNGSRITKRKTARKNNSCSYFRFGGNKKDPLNLNGLIQKQMQSTSNSSAVDDNLANNNGKDRPVEILLQPDIFDPLRLDPSSHNDEDLSSISSLPSTSIETNSKYNRTVQPSRTKRNLTKRKYMQPPRYGNYHGYYGYRRPEQDQRFQYFQRDWFQDKQVLDIGCHSGHVTFYVAEHFQPQQIVGLDIDPHLIQRARHQLSNQIGVNNDPTRRYPFNLQFQQGNFVLENDMDLENINAEYDTIIAFSVTKWIHLNFGDQGLKRFFCRVYRSLREGGIFLLEPQPWSSYRLKRRMTKEIQQNYEQIKFKPTEFISYLLSSEVGFESCKTLPTPDHIQKGFQRSIFLLTKKKTAIGC